MSFYVVVVFAYVVVLIGIAFYRSTQIKTQDDYMVASRHAPTYMLVGSLVCTWIGSGSLFGGAGLAFRQGFSALWLSAGAWVGIIVVYFLAPRVRRIAEYTVPDILERRYNAFARILGTITIIIAYLTIAGYQFRGGGRLLNIILGIDPELGGAITCGIIILLTMLAGMVSILSVDVVNGLIMITALFLALPVALKNAGGWTNVTSILPPEHFSLLGGKSFTWAVGIFFPTFLLLIGESSMYQKFFSAKDERAAKRAALGMVIGVVLIETALAAVAVIGSSFLWNNPEFQVHANQETVILQVAFRYLPTFLGAFLLAAATAIILSTGNTFLMTPATNLTRDIYQRFIKPDASDKEIVLFQRLTIVAFGVLAYLVATQFTTILAMALTAYTMIGAGITPALLAAFLWKRTTVQGGVASILAGMGATIGITIINKIRLAQTGKLFLPEDYIVIPAAILSILVLIVISLMTPPPPRAKWEPFIEK